MLTELGESIQNRVIRLKKLRRSSVEGSQRATKFEVTLNYLAKNLHKFILQSLFFFFTGRLQKLIFLINHISN